MSNGTRVSMCLFEGEHEHEHECEHECEGDAARKLLPAAQMSNAHVRPCVCASVRPCVRVSLCASLPLLCLLCCACCTQPLTGVFERFWHSGKVTSMRPPVACECGMRNAECGMRNAECGMQNVACDQYRGCKTQYPLVVPRRRCSYGLVYSGVELYILLDTDTGC